MGSTIRFWVEVRALFRKFGGPPPPQPIDVSWDVCSCAVIFRGRVFVCAVGRPVIGCEASRVIEQLQYFKECSRDWVIY